MLFLELRLRFLCEPSERKLKNQNSHHQVERKKIKAFFLFLNILSWFRIFVHNIRLWLKGGTPRSSDVVFSIFPYESHSVW